MLVPRGDSGAAVQQRLHALRPRQRDAQQLAPPRRVLRRGVLLPHSGEGVQRRGRVRQCAGKMVEVEDGVPGGVVGAAAVVQVGKGAEIGVVVGSFQRRGQRLLLDAGEVSLLRCLKIRRYIKHGEMLLHKMQTEGIHRADGGALQPQLLAAQVAVAGVGAYLLRKAGRNVSAQLGRRRIREGHDKQAVSVDGVRRVSDEADDALDQNAGLAGTGRRRDQQTAAPRRDRRRLRRGELNFRLLWHGFSYHSSNGSSLILIVRSCSPSRWAQAVRKSQ